MAPTQCDVKNLTWNWSLSPSQSPSRSTTWSCSCTQMWTSRKEILKKMASWAIRPVLNVALVDELLDGTIA